MAVTADNATAVCVYFVLTHTTGLVVSVTVHVCVAPVTELTGSPYNIILMTWVM